MGKTPAYLKGLSETRARVAADVERYGKLSAHISRKLQDAQLELAACDRLLRKFDPRVDPEKIGAIEATKGRYGPEKHGLKKCLVAYLQEQHPAEVTTTELALVVQAKFGLDFADWMAWRLWVKNSVAPTMKALVKAGSVERLHDPADPTVQVGRWRWAGEGAASVGELEARAAESGVRVAVAKGDGSYY